MSWKEELCTIPKKAKYTDNCLTLLSTYPSDKRDVEEPQQEEEVPVVDAPTQENKQSVISINSSTTARFDTQ